jgi:hypothetical protein
MFSPAAGSVSDPVDEPQIPVGVERAASPVWNQGDASSVRSGIPK